MSQKNINPKMLRFMIIFPNVLSYFLLIGLIVFISTSADILKAGNVYWMWIIVTAGLAVGSVYTTYSIVKKIKQGIL